MVIYRIKQVFQSLLYSGMLPGRRRRFQLIDSKNCKRNRRNDIIPYGLGQRRQKEQPPRGELSEDRKAMHDLVDSISDDQVRRLLQIAHAAFEK